MSIILEDGTGLSTAETLASVAECDAFHVKRGNTSWAALSTPAKEWALRKANDYLRQTFRLRWRGFKVNTTQACEWPRYGVVVDGWYVDSTSVPSVVKDVVADLALRASTTTLNADQGQKVKSEKVGPLETEYSEFATSVTRLSSVEDALAPYLSQVSGGLGVPLVRR